MRILHVVPSVGRASGGLGPVALGLAGAQRQLGHHSEVWCLDYRDGSSAVAASGEGQQFVRVFPITGPRFAGFSWPLQRALLARETRFDVVHQHGIWLAQSLCTSLCRSRRGWPTIVAPHGSLDPYALRRSRWKKWLALRAYEGRNLRSASCLHALSEAESASFRAFGLRNRVASIANGISAEWLDGSGCAERFRESIGLPRGTRVLLYLSRIHPKKGLPMLLDALHLLGDGFPREWMLVIAGPDEAGHQADIERQAIELGLDRSVRFVGPVYERRKRDAFAAADLFVLPSHSEGAPIVILEALGAGVPVIATRASPWRELGSESCGWWVEVSAEGLAAALSDALSRRKPDLAAMGANGRRLVVEKYTWRAVAAQTLDLYSDLLGEAPRAGTVASRARRAEAPSPGGRAIVG